MLTSKKRAELRSAAQTEKAIIHIGKNGVIAETEIEAQNAFNNREIVKGRVLETSPVTAGEAAIALSIASASEVIQVVGNVFTLYKKLEDRLDKPKKKSTPKSSKLTGTKASLKLHPKPRPRNQIENEDNKFDNKRKKINNEKRSNNRTKR